MGKEGKMLNFTIEEVEVTVAPQADMPYEDC